MSDADHDFEGYWVEFEWEATGEKEKVYIGEVQYIFLHVPRTGGTYVARGGDVLSPIFDLNHSVLVDDPNWVASDYPPSPGYNKYMMKDVTLVTKPNRICFATVRNPFDWFVSYFYFRSREKESFEQKKKKFDYFMRMLMDNEVGWPSRKLLYFAFFRYSGNFIVDRLIHQENLDLELEEFANESVDLWYKESDKRLMKSYDRNSDYRVYYSDDLAERVSKVWERDLVLFGYNFNDGKIPGILNKVVTSEQKSVLTYDWGKDKLIYEKDVLPIFV